MCDVKMMKRLNDNLKAKMLEKYCKRSEELENVNIKAELEALKICEPNLEHIKKCDPACDKNSILGCTRLICSILGLKHSCEFGKIIPESRLDSKLWAKYYNEISLTGDLKLYAVEELDILDVLKLVNSCFEIWSNSKIAKNKNKHYQLLKLR